MSNYDPKVDFALDILNMYEDHDKYELRWAINVLMDYPEYSIGQGPLNKAFGLTD